MTDTTMLKFRVCGRPYVQGSARAFVRGRRAVVTHDDKRGRLHPWRRAVAGACLTALYAADPDHDVNTPRFSGPVAVLVEFVLPRLSVHPKTERGRAPGWPKTGLDLDKLQRAVGDALVPVALKDDAIVCQWSSSKRYAELGEEPGAYIEIIPLGETSRR